MTDFAAIGIEMDSRPVVEGTKALDALGESATRVEQKVRVSNGQMNDTAKIMQAQADQAKAAAQANAVLGNTTSALTIGQSQLIDKFREMGATVGMSRSQLMAYQAAQLGVTEQTKDAVAAVKAHEDALKTASQAKADAARSTNLLTDALKLLAAGYAALKIADYVKDSALMAARYETLGIVMSTVGKTAGYTSVQMDTAAQSIAAQGITMITARESAIKLVQAHVDLTNASKLARIAQDAAVIGNINSSEAFDRLVNGVSRGNVLILRNIGINVNLQAAYQQMAESLGKTSKELTENERVQARLNAVMDRGSDIAGTYEAAMGTAGKQILSMQRYVDDLKTTFGETFNEVLTIAVMGLTSGLKDANGQVNDLAKNGQLAQWGHDLTTVMVGIVNAISNVITMTKLAAVEAAHATGKDGGAGLGYAAPDANPLAKLGASLFASMGASTAAPTATSEQTYQAEVLRLAGHLNQFQRAADEFEAARLAKKQSDAAARLKVDQDYAAAATAILLKAGNDAAKLEAARQQVNALYQKTYVGTPTFRDTEGRESAPKVDQADNVRLQNQLARIQEVSAADKAYADYSMQLDDQRHKAGELGDDEYYKSRKDHLDTLYLSETDMYDKELAALRAHHNSTDAEREKNQKAIDDVLGKQEAARAKYSHDSSLMDDAERLRQKAVADASQESMNKYVSGLNAEAEKLEQSNGAHEKSRSAIEREAVARLDLAIASQQQLVAQQDTNGASEKEVEQGKTILKFLQDMRDARARIATAAATQENDIFSKRAADQAIQDWQRAGASIADSLSNAFGKGGKAVGDMFKAYSEGVSGQLKAQKDLAAAKKLSDDNPEKIDAINRAQLQGSQAQLKSYGDMAQAAQGFFDQGSRGYKAMQAAAEVMRAAEIGLSLVKGVNAVLTQGEGDPYTAFARMAAMAAVVTGLGVAISGGGSAPSSASRQAAQGTGSVLGDSNAKSDSIAKSIELSAANSSTQINYLSGMLTALQAIQTGINSFAAELVQSTNISNPNVHLNTSNGLAGTVGSAGLAAGGAALGGMAGAGLTAFTSLGAVGGPIGMIAGAVLGYVVSKIPAISNLMTSIFGGKQSVSDSGFTLDKASLGSILAGGVNAQSYADIHTSGGLFGHSSDDVKTASLGADANNQFATIIKSMASGIQQAASLLGVCGDDFTKQLDSFVVDIGNVSLKGLTGDEIQKQLEAVFSKLGDQMAQAAIPDLQQFEQVGEGYLQTLTRVATDYAKLDASLQSIGATFGQTGIQSVAARESLIALAGGIDKFQSQTADFAKNFLTKGQQMAPVQAFVTQQLNSINLGWIKTREDFAAEIASLSGRLDDAGAQKTYAALMSLEGAFASVTPEIVDATKSLQETADERKSLQDKLDSLTMASTQLHEKERATIDASNLALYDRVSALQAEKDAIQAMKDAASGLLGDVDSTFTVLQNVTKTTTDAISARITAEKALSDAIKSTLGSMTVASTDLTDRMAAEAQIKSALAIAKAGGPLPTADSLQGAMSTVSKDDSAKFSSYADYLKDLYSTKNDLAQLGDLADNSLSVDQKQLDSLNKMLDTAKQQVDVLKGIDTTGLSIEQALAGFQIAMVRANQNPVVAANSAINGAYQQYLGRAPDSQGLAWWQNAAGNGAPVSQIVDGIAGSTEATLGKLYQSVLGRAPDAQGLAFWMQAYGPTMDASETADWMKAAQKDPGYKAPGFAAGGDFAGGWRIVGENGPELEATGPARIFNASQTSGLLSRLSSSSGNSDALLAEVKSLREEIKLLRTNNSAENVAQVKQQQSTVDLLTRVIYGGDAIQTKAAS